MILNLEEKGIWFCVKDNFIKSFLLIYLIKIEVKNGSYFTTGIFATNND